MENFDINVYVLLSCVFKLIHLRFTCTLQTFTEHKRKNQGSRNSRKQTKEDERPITIFSPCLL